MMSLLAIRRLVATDAMAAARLHQRGGALIPGYDTSLHSSAEYVTFYRDTVLVDCTVWGAFAGTKLRGHIALLPGRIAHLYVDPEFIRRANGQQLGRKVQDDQAELRLSTFQSNVRARRFYEYLGFVIEELTDGSRNEEKLPDLTYHWRR